MNALDASILPAAKRRRINSTVASLPPSGIRKFFDLVMGRSGVISLGVGEPDFVTPWHICEAGIHSIETGRTSYTPNNGLPELRARICEYLKTDHNTDYAPDKNVLVTVGGSEALDTAFRALVEPGDEVLVVDPSFVAYAPLAALAGAVPVRVPTGPETGFAPDIDQLKGACSENTRAIIINYPNNPTGAGLNHDQAAKLAEFVLSKGLILISDEIYVPLSYDGASPTFAAFPELKDNLILIHGFSKAWAMTGWRLGFAAGPVDLIDGMKKIHQYSLMCASTASQYAALEALKHGASQVEVMRKEYDARRRFVVHHFNRIGLDCLLPRGAFYVFPSIQSTGLSSEAFAEGLLERENVAVVPGTAFGACGEGFIRCSYAASMEDLKTAIQRIESFIKSI